MRAIIFHRWSSPSKCVLKNNVVFVIVDHKWWKILDMYIYHMKFLRVDKYFENVVDVEVVCIKKQPP